MNVKKTLLNIFKKNKSIYFVFNLLRTFFMRFLLTIKILICKKENIKNDRELIILGTGPSLKQDINKIVTNKNNYAYMVVNSFCLDSNFTLIKPEYYVLADPAYYSEDAKGHGIKDRNFFLKMIKEKLNWKMTIVLPKVARHSHLVQELSYNQFIKFDFINGNTSYQPIIGNKFITYNRNIAMPKVQNVLHMCLYFGIYQKFSTIYLFGADHNWCKDITVTDDNIVSIVENHCYEYEHDKIHPMEKVDGSYWTMGELFEAWTIVYNGYYLLKSYADFNHVKIYNESAESFIDAFDRKSGRF